MKLAEKRILDKHSRNGDYEVQRMQLALAQRGVCAGSQRLMRRMLEHGWLHERKRCPKS